MAMRSVLPMTRVQRYHGSASVIERERKGQSTWFSVGDLPFSRIAGSRVFTPSELYEVYRLCPDIRAPIDLISLRVAQTGWVVSPKANLKKGTRQWLKARALAAQVTHWLSKPNAEETWHAFAQKWAHDALVFDASAVEHARTPKGQLEELVEWRGGDFTPLQDEHGRVYRYRQDMSVGGPVYFLPEDLTYTNIFVNTTYPDGQPLIESLVEEFLTLRASSVHFRRAVDADEIPPGILFLSGVADVAYQRLEQRFKLQAGRDDVLRMVNGFDPAARASWIEMKRSAKDLDWVPNVQAVRETIWRVFHVSPVQMGETGNTPRASAEVQLQVGDMALINSMLIRLADVANVRWLPMIAALFGPPQDVELIEFVFDTSTALSQADQKTKAERLTMLWDRGLLTSDEVRSDFGYDPLRMTSDPDMEDDQDAAGDGEGGGGGAGAGETDVDASRRLLVGRQRAARRDAKLALSIVKPAQGHAPWTAPARWWDTSSPAPRWRHPIPRALPSGWQPASRFEGARVLSVVDLAELVEGYTATVTPLYERARRDVVKAATAAVADGQLTASDAAPVVSAVSVALNALTVDWADQTKPMYDGAARLGADTGEGWEGGAVAWANRAEVYRGDAIRYLNTTTPTAGLIASLRQELLSVIVEATRRAPAPPRPSQDGVAREVVLSDGTILRAEEKLPAALGSFLEAIRRVFDRNQHRISNWAGKLVELAHGTLTESLAIADARDAVEGNPDPWLVNWIEVADNATCGTCKVEGGKGWRRMSELPTMPGGATECGARCRCLLQFARESEVKSGTAIKIGPIT